MRSSRHANALARLTNPAAPGDRAAPGDLGSLSAPNAGGNPRAPGAPQTPPQNTFFKNCESTPKQACFSAAKSNLGYLGYNVAEKVRNVFRTTCRT